MTRLNQFVEFWDNLIIFLKNVWGKGVFNKKPMQEA